jgi:predicted RNA-binding Zn-ribbon protein involved in translation (DUF1610 family)
MSEKLKQYRELNGNKSIEQCPICEEEITLKAEMKKQKCPKCGYIKAKPCLMCMTVFGDCIGKCKIV